MDREKKKKVKRIVSLACIAVVVILLATMPLLAEKSKAEDGPQASILSKNVEKGSVHTEVVGGGTLAEDDPISVSVPASVKLTKYMVSNGDTVAKGDAIAGVDRVTVMTAISEVQDTLDILAERIDEEGKKEIDSGVVALAGGTVKILYAKEGETVQDVMLKHGALAVLSLDGLMAVDIETESKLEAGTSVKVTLSNGKTVSGNVEENLLGTMTITMKDNGYEVGKNVRVKTKDGTEIGSGKLYIYSPWNATAYAGTIASIKVRSGEKVSAGETLIKLEDAGYTATYRQLVNVRKEYEELLLDLFDMYQTETLSAPCDGIVSGVDKSSNQLLNGKEQAYLITPMQNAPNGNDTELYSNYIGKVTAIGQNGWGVSINPQSMAIGDYKNLSEVSLDEKNMTELVVYNPVQTGGAETPIYELQKNEWKSIDKSKISVGDILLFASDSKGEYIWIVRVKEEKKETEVPGKPETPGESDEPTQPSVPTEPNMQPEQNTQTEPGTTYPNGEMWDGTTGFPQGDIPVTESEEELYSLDIVDVAAVTPRDNMTLDITVNELDVNSLYVGMEAEVMVKALGGEKLSATITDISNTGTNNGGYSSFTVELTMERKENMLIGMNATATMVTTTVSDVLVVPMEALVEEGTKTVIYTGYDKDKEMLLHPVEVSVGTSDGQTVEIVEGLEEGATYYYAYYDKVEISNIPEFGSGGFGGGFGRGFGGR